ncbi:MAG: 16S rRNA (adenine(1518)-N(6)/adenine(1519)-N(6))-dimethyltransferase RsmA [Bacteroidia bacterium]|nr:16S rRNA (adenine(1518)-N(6)/adenine(1519)-N(6))-dimethyltransferase RsmA [Bacteroidia bacterium]
MTFIRTKKHLGQHFLKDRNIAEKIVRSLQLCNIRDVLEVGPGMGILTRSLLKNEKINLLLIEIDKESVDYLNDNFPTLKGKIIHKDFLEEDLQNQFNSKIAIIGNFPYNISSQIFFKILENKNIVWEAVGMVQKEVAERICARPGNKTYGILSVFLQAYYKIEYLFTVNETVFIPPPNVKSAVIRLTRNGTSTLECNELLFFQVVKTSFNQRRKMLRNSLKSLLNETAATDGIFDKRPEQLSVDEFVYLTNLISR